MTTNVVSMSFDVFKRMADFEALHLQRLDRVIRALKRAGIQYAIVGGNAVASWVATVEPEAVRAPTISTFY